MREIFPPVDADGPAELDSDCEPTIFASGDAFRRDAHMRIRQQHTAEVAAALLLQQQQLQQQPQLGNRPRNISFGSVTPGAQGRQVDVTTGDDRFNAQNRQNIGEQSGKSLPAAFEVVFNVNKLADTNLNPQPQGNGSGSVTNAQGGQGVQGGPYRKYFLLFLIRSKSLTISRSYHSSASHA
jgi:hypothetical protein